MRESKRTPDLFPPHHPLDPVAQEHIAQHQAAHHGLGLGKLGNRHVEIIKADELRAPPNRGRRKASAGIWATTGMDAHIP
jgi:hypothetical protein